MDHDSKKKQVGSDFETRQPIRTQWIGNSLLLGSALGQPDERALKSPYLPYYNEDSESHPLPGNTSTAFIFFFLSSDFFLKVRLGLVRLG